MATAEDVRDIIKAKRETRSRGIKAPKSLPKDVSLEDIIKSLPSEVFVQDRLKSFGSLFVTVALLATSMYLLKVTPWYLWPIGWGLAGTSTAGLYVIAHDCVHKSFAKTKAVNYLVGTLAMLPLGYSFYSWKTSHKYSCHGGKPNTAVSTPRVADYIWKWAKGHTFWLASVGYWAEQRRSLDLVNSEEKLRLRVSLLGLYIFAVVSLSSMWYTVGIFGILKYWLLPWFAYHFVISTTTLLPSSVLEEKSKSFVVQCDYPKWLEFLCNDISLSIPRNVSTSIPHYNLRKAYKALKQQWGEYFLEIDFEWRLLSDLMSSAAPDQSFVPIAHVPVAPMADGKMHHHDGDIAPVPAKRHGVAAGIANMRAFLARINWLHAGILIPVPVASIYGLIYVPFTTPTAIWCVVYYFCTGLGITAGYHRLFAHRGYSARQPFKWIIMMFGSGAVEGSVRWWCRDHRAHHRYTDTDRDPYSAQNGFWYAHIGWMLIKQDPGKIGRANIDDLNADPWIRWQHKHYVPIAIFMGVIFPTLVAGILWGDWMGGYFHAGLLRLTFVHHSTFMVNSLAHYLGEISFADNHTPRDSMITAFLTLGEGYHNFHHEFPSDYRNAIKWFQYDPTKWLIKGLSYIGQTYNLKMFPENELQKGQLQMKQKLLDGMKTRVDWGTTPHDLPLITPHVFSELAADHTHKLIVIDNIVHDVTAFIDEHPGGKAIIQSYAGKDATLPFRGAVYEHSNGAHNLLSQMRVARVDAQEWREHNNQAALETKKDI